MTPIRVQLLAWAGLIAGGVAWYCAHDLGFYLVRANCRSPWIVPAINLTALLIAAAGGATSLYSSHSPRPAAAWIGTGGAALFALVILWQGIAGLVYSGCER